MKKTYLLITLLTLLLLCNACKKKPSLNLLTKDSTINIMETLEVKYETANLRKDSRVEITIDNPLIASLTNNEIKGNMAGQTEVKVTLFNNKNKVITTSSFKLTVVNNENFIVNKTLYTLTLGEELNLNSLYTIENLLPTSIIDVTVTNPSILEIDNGIIKTLKVGTTTIVITSSSKPDVSVVIVIIVEYEEELSVTTTNYLLEIGEITDLLYQTNHLKEETEVIVKIEDESIIKYENKKIQALKVGTTQIELSLSTKPSDKKIITVTVVNQETISTSILSYTLTLGDEIELDYQTAYLRDDTLVNINVLNQEIITIDNKVIKALKVGTTSIELSLSTKPDEKIIIDITVLNPENISVIKTTYDLIINNDTLLEYQTAYLREGTEVIITSLDDEIVKVVNGYLKPVKAGSTSISIYLSTDITNKINIQCTVHEEISLEITNKIDKLSLYSTYTLSKSVNDDFYLSTLTWKSSDETILSISSTGVVSTYKTGQVTISLITSTSQVGKDEFIVEVYVDPFVIFDYLAIDDVLVQNVTTYGQTELKQIVLGSVNRYAFKELNLIEKIIPINTNIYTGQTATTDIITKAEALKKVRPGILLEELKYIVYHDTGNNTKGSGALNHANYLVSEANETARARSWHYTVDENVIYHHIPDNEVTWQGDSYEAYAKSIGIETCVDYGSDLYKTWQNMGKLLAKLVNQYDLTLENIVQHYDMSGKDCPKTLRNSGLYDYAISLVEAELIVLKYLQSYSIEFTSLSPEYVDNTGKVIKQPLYDTRLAYEIKVTDTLGNTESKLYYATIKGITSNPLPNESSIVNEANKLDQKIASLNKTLVPDDELLIQTIRAEYDQASNDVKRLMATYEFFTKKEYELMLLFKQDTEIIINEIFAFTNDPYPYIGYDYLELYNTTNKIISLENYLIKIKVGENEYEYPFYQETQILPNNYLLIAFGELNLSDQTIPYFPLPDVSFDDRFPVNDFIITIEGTNLHEEVTISKTEMGFTNNQESISRKYLIDTNQMTRDFCYKPLSLTNANKETIKDGSINQKVYDFDYQVIRLNRNITTEDKTKIESLITEYKSFTNEEQDLVTTRSLLDDIYRRLMGAINPNINVLYEIVNQIPKQIVNDYVLPTKEGLTYKYKENEDTSYYDLTTGKYLKVSYEPKIIKIICTYIDVSQEIEINFGIATTNDTIIYNTGAVAPSTGNTSDGKGTYEDQLKSIGFSNLAITVQNKIYFIGKGCFILLNKPLNGNEITRTDLRPLGGDDNFYNYGIVNGVATQYRGTGVMYYNNSDIPLSFDLSNTYGRNNSGAYGYFKVLFSKNNLGEYFVSEILTNSGQNESTDNVIFTLNPGEYLWCPHSYETNQKGGTWLMNHGTSAYGGVLNLNEEVKFTIYKSDFTD